jgi:hypothetical protein
VTQSFSVVVNTGPLSVAPRRRMRSWFARRARRSR